MNSFFKEENTAVSTGASQLEAHLQKQIAAAKAEAQAANERNSALDESLALLR